MARRPIECLRDERGMLTSNLLIVLKLEAVFWENKSPWNKIKGFRGEMLADLDDLVKNVLVAEAADRVRVPVDDLVVARALLQPRLVISYHHVRVARLRDLPLVRSVAHYHPIHVANIGLADHAERYLPGLARLRHKLCILSLRNNA